MKLQEQGRDTREDRVMTAPLKVGTVTREEEFKIVERRLLSLKEEVRLHRTRESNQYQERVVVRQQEAVITRL